jgi:hypothetical protein
MEPSAAGLDGLVPRSKSPAWAERGSVPPTRLQSDDNPVYELGKDRAAIRADARK